MHELHKEAQSTNVTSVGAAVATPGEEIARMRLVDAPPGAKVRLASGRIVVATGVVIQGARFVRPVLGGVKAPPGRGELQLGSMEVVNGGQLVTIATSDMCD